MQAYITYQNMERKYSDEQTCRTARFEGAGLFAAQTCFNVRLDGVKSCPACSGPSLTNAVSLCRVPQELQVVCWVVQAPCIPRPRMWHGGKSCTKQRTSSDQAVEWFPIELSNTIRRTHDLKHVVDHVQVVFSDSIVRPGTTS